MAASRRGPRGRRASAARPASSPCEPAEGCRQTCGRPAISPSASWRFHISSSAPCARSGSCSGCRRAWPGQRRDALVQARVVLHRARAQRVEAGVEIEVALGEAHVVAHDLRLGELRQARRLRRGAALRQQLRRGRPAGTSSAGHWNARRPGAPFSKIVSTRAPRSSSAARASGTSRRGSRVALISPPPLALALCALGGDGRPEHLGEPVDVGAVRRSVSATSSPPRSSSRPVSACRSTPGIDARARRSGA